MRRLQPFALAVLSGLSLSAAAHATKPLPPPVARTPYHEVVAQTAAMVNNPQAQQLAAAQKLQILNLTWEDTGRYKNSAVGPNISDMTIQVQTPGPQAGQYQLTCMPVIRFPNFEDRSADIAPDKFFLMVGNEKNDKLRPVSLREYLANIRKYLSKPESWKGDQTYLLANRDSHVLVSAQACFLPVPKEGSAEFNPVLFNYQSTAGDPAVLTILATREGTSATIIDNQRDGFAAGRTWGQRLFFNHNGERAGFTGQRLSDFKADPKTTGSVTAAGEKGLNLVLLIQVPLRQKPKALPPQEEACAPLANDPVANLKKAEARDSDVEAAVIGHGKVEGPFTEFDNLAVERDPNFPVRVTVQFYKATSNGVVSERDVAEVAQQIEKIYAQADYVGSLVTDGNTNRPTEYDGDKIEPPQWWDDFWARHAQATGFDRAAVIGEFRRVKGETWSPRTEKELADEAASYHFPPRDATALGLAWHNTTPGTRLLYGMLLAGLGVAAFGVGRGALRRAGTVR